VYAAIGVTVDGTREVLGLWIGTGGSLFVALAEDPAAAAAAGLAGLGDGRAVTAAATVAPS
jgi:hypothetical protein